MASCSSSGLLNNARAVSPSAALEERCHFGCVDVWAGERVSAWTAAALLSPCSMSEGLGEIFWDASLVADFRDRIPMVSGMEDRKGRMGNKVTYK